MSKKYPSLKPNEVCKCLEALGFEHTKFVGDHKYYEKGDRIAQVDMGEKAGFGTPGMKIIINNTGYDAEVFYRATKKTAKKINKTPLTAEELSELDD